MLYQICSALEFAYITLFYRTAWLISTGTSQAAYALCTHNHYVTSTKTANNKSTVTFPLTINLYSNRTPVFLHTHAGEFASLHRWKVCPKATFHIDDFITYKCWWMHVAHTHTHIDTYHTKTISDTVRTNWLKPTLWEAYNQLWCDWLMRARVSRPIISKAFHLGPCQAPG